MSGDAGLGESSSLIKGMCSPYPMADRCRNVQVTLQILTALIEKLPRDLLIYAPTVLTVLETVLRSNDITMAEDSIATFETFCRHLDMVALAAEQAIAYQYRDVVRTYVGFADASPSTFSKIPRSPPIALRWRNAGLRAIKAVVSSDGLAADGGESLRITLPVILGNLYTGEEDVLEPLQARLQEPETNEPDQAQRRRASAAPVPTVDAVNGDVTVAAQSAADVDRKNEMDVKLLALRCLERIVVSGSNRGQIRIATGVVLRFIMSQGPIRANGNGQADGDTGENWATSLIELIARWCPVQVRFVILVTAMEILSERPPAEKTLEKPFTIVYLINWLLKSQVNMIGLSVMDVLLGLLHYVSTLLAPPETKEALEDEKQDSPRNSEVAMSPQRRELLSLLQDCIGNLATHIYYGDQITDLVKAILSRFKSSAVQEHLSTHPSSGQSETDGSPNSETSMNGFALAGAKVAALKSVKNILVVANLRRPMAAAGVESRDHIGVDAWEGTQWLLRAPERNVRSAYADAFLSWLKFETTKSDLRLKDKNERRSSPLPKRELQGNNEAFGKRTASGTMGQREKTVVVSQFNCLRLLHLTIYDIALEHGTEESEILLLHLLLTTLTENLGVNAVRFGLPMILKLQDDVNTVGTHHTPATKVNIGSLCYGYFWALSEKFDFDTSRIGNEIRNEIERRRRYGLWFQKIRLPPMPLDSIIAGDEAPTDGNGTGDLSKLKPFQSGVGELVDLIEMAYNSTAASPAQSPPASPNRSLGIPAFGGSMSGATASLPRGAKEQMLSSWSREACLAAVEQDNAREMSVNGSKIGTLGMRSQVQTNGENSSIANSPVFAHQGDANGMKPPKQFRRGSVPDLSGSPVGTSSRGSPVRVNELRRVLSVNTNNRSRRLSPLRGHLDASNSSVASSSSESLVSGAFSVSDAGDDATSSRRQSTKGGQPELNDDGLDTPRASTAALPGQPEQSHHARRGRADAIPPVPPIPAALNLPGCFPNDSQRSLSPGDRPFTAPNKKQSHADRRTGAAPDSNTLDKRKSRSLTGLAIEAGIEDPGLVSGFLETYGNGDPTEAEDKITDRRDIENLLNGYLSPDTGSLNGEPQSPTGLGRRNTRGIGRPPY